MFVRRARIAIAILPVVVLGFGCAKEPTQVSAGASGNGTTAPVTESGQTDEPLASGLLNDVEFTTVRADQIILDASTSSKDAEAGVCLRLRHADNDLGGSLCGDPRQMDDVVLVAFTPATERPASDREHYGVTRNSVVTLAATTKDGGIHEIPVTHSDAFPELAFFYFRDIGGITSLEGFDSSGTVVASASDQTLSYTRHEVAARTLSD